MQDYGQEEPQKAISLHTSGVKVVWFSWEYGPLRNPNILDAHPDLSTGSRIREFPTRRGSKAAHYETLQQRRLEAVLHLDNLEPAYLKC